MTDACERTSDESAFVPPSEDLLARVRAWIASDPDPDTRAELKQLIACDDGDGMAARFNAGLTFGTAGLRGEIGGGPNRMNRVVVARASLGFAHYLSQHAGAHRPLVVIGQDARTKSDVFADDTAAVLSGAGCDALALPGALPTPVLAFAVRHLGADGGVMVTASHNPAGDNGYKVYLGGNDDGAQIVSPTDIEIQERIAAAQATPFASLARGKYSHARAEVIDSYIEQTAAVAPARPGAFPRVAYTPLHGVGWNILKRVFDAAGYPEPSVVASQAEPDPTFPSIAFPNPEESGALDLVIAHAKTIGADLVLANDPDADRLAVCIPEGDSYRMLTGNELGVLLAWWAGERAARTGKTGTMATTFVSAPALERIAAVYGCDCLRTPSGFKWIGRVPNLIYGYEEALGYLVNPETVHDKDGISAAVAVMSMATELARAGSSLADKLAELAQEFGGFSGNSFSLRRSTTAEVATLMATLRATSGDGFLEGVSDMHDYLPKLNLLAWDLDDGTRVLARPSGTEPKLKFYIYANSAERASDVAELVRKATSSLT